MLETDVFVEQIKNGMPDEYAAYQAIVADLLAGKIEVGTAVGADQAYVDAEKAKASGLN